MILFSVLSIIGFSIVLCKQTKWRIETTPFFVIASLICVLYCGAYLHTLKAVTYSLYGLGILAFIYASWIVVQAGSQRDTRYLTPGLVIPSAWIALMCAVAATYQLSAWDEFTHWGAHAFLLAWYQGFLPATITTTHKTYPVGTALFYYFFSPSTTFHLASAYVAQTLLIWIPLLILFQNMAWRQWPQIGVLLVLIVLLFSGLSVDIGPKKTLYVDAIAGIFWGACLARVMITQPKTTDLIFYWPIVCALVLLKPGLFIFVLFLTIFLLLRAFFNPILLHSKRQMIVYLLAVLSIPMVAWLTNASWQHYLTVTQVPSEWQLSATPHDMLNTLLHWKFSTLQLMIIKNFWMHTLTHNLYLLVILVTVTYLTYKATTAIRYEIILTHLCLFSFFCIILAGLLILYLYSFVWNEAVTTASYERYMMIPYLGWLMVILTTSTHYLPNKKGLAIGSIILLFGIESYVYWHNQQVANSTRGIYTLQRQMMTISQAVNKITPNTARISIVWQNSTGLEKVILAYQLLPRQIDLKYFSYGKPGVANDVWAMQVSPQAFNENLKQFDYLLVANGDANFWHLYANSLPKNPPPFINYQICVAQGFNPTNLKNCHSVVRTAYLFKILHNHSSLQLLPITLNSHSA